MNVASLRELSLRDHKSALWWLGLLYRRPERFRNAVAAPEGRAQILHAAALLTIHALPYMALLSAIGRLVLFGALELPTIEVMSPDTFGLVAFHLRGIALGIVGGIAFGIAGGIVVGIINGFALGIAFGISWGIAFGIAGGIIAVGIIGGMISGITIAIVVGITLGITGGIAGGIAVGITYGAILGILGGIAVGITVAIAFGIIHGIAGRTAVGIASGIAGGFALGITFGIAVGTAIGVTNGTAFKTAVGIAVGIALGIASGIAGAITIGITEGIVFGIGVGTSSIVTILRLYYYPIHILFVWPRVHGKRYRYHPVAWDDLCSVAFVGLDQLLVDYAKHDAAKAGAEIQRLIDTYPSQRRQALLAQTILLAREAAATRELGRLDDIVARLPQGGEGFLNQTEKVRTGVNRIAAQQRILDVNVINWLLRKQTAELLCEYIESFRNNIGGFYEPLRSEFSYAADRWSEIAHAQRDEIEREYEAENRKEHTIQVFRPGDPVDRNAEAFIPRVGVIRELLRQVMMATGCPGIVLYGRRRCGKSTILKNLEGFLPSDVQSVTISLQDARAFTSTKDFVRLLAGEIEQRIGSSASLSPAIDLPDLQNCLKRCNNHLAAENKRLIIALDEYEIIDRKIGEGTFSEDLLAMIRESIQTDRRITWLFAGSRDITELTNARWTSYLISARTVEVPMFTLDDSTKLLTNPLEYSQFWKDKEDSRPRFSDEFWGGHATIVRIHNEAGGWPAVVQMIAEAVIDLLNDSDKRVVDAELLEQALDKVVVSSFTAWYEIARADYANDAAWEYLAAFAEHETQPQPQDRSIRAVLLTRKLVETDGELWRLRVPLMRRWLQRYRDTLT